MKKTIIFLVVAVIMTILIGGSYLVWKSRKSSSNTLYRQGSRQNQQVVNNSNATNTNKGLVAITKKVSRKLPMIKRLT